jgi:3'-phosphoadenosine 5'-phosphosulfate sulfotransferase (PAPS reductase)/FAD synthetase
MRNKNNQIKTITTDTDFPLLPTIEVIEKLKKDTGITPIDELQNKVIYIRRT